MKILIGVILVGFVAGLSSLFGYLGHRSNKKYYVNGRSEHPYKDEQWIVRYSLLGAMIGIGISIWIGLTYLN